MLCFCLTASGFLRLWRKNPGGGKSPALHWLSKVDMHFSKLHKNLLETDCLLSEKVVFSTGVTD